MSFQFLAFVILQITFILFIILQMTFVLQQINYFKPLSIMCPFFKALWDVEEFAYKIVS